MFRLMSRVQIAVETRLHYQTRVQTRLNYQKLMGVKMPNTFICSNVFQIYSLCCEEKNDLPVIRKFLFKDKYKVVAKCCSPPSKEPGIKCIYQ